MINCSTLAIIYCVLFVENNWSTINNPSKCIEIKIKSENLAQFIAIYSSYSPNMCTVQSQQTARAVFLESILIFHEIMTFKVPQYKQKKKNFFFGLFSLYLIALMCYSTFYFIDFLVYRPSFCKKYNMFYFHWVSQSPPLMNVCKKL